jgi:osmotically-inducible protein OsmY
MNPMTPAAPSDQWIERAVAEELEWAPHVDATHVHVSVRDGIVHLAGHVRSLAERAAAERTVHHVAGVRGIDVALEVRRPAAHLHSDAELARRAADVLDWDARIPGNDIVVRVEHGTVILDGVVDWHWQRAEAEAAVHCLAGVVAVDNRIRLRDATAAPADLHERVLRALHRHAELDATGIAVEAKDGTVTLSGTVPGFSQRHIAENAAWAVHGVGDVIDRLTVAHARRPSVA